MWQLYLAYALCLPLVARGIGRHASVLLFADDDSLREGIDFPSRPSALRDVQKRSVTALKHMVWWVVAYLVLVGYLHQYVSEHHHLAAEREAAMQIGPPYGCDGNMDPATMSWGEKIRLMSGYSLEQQCVAYLEHKHSSVWPNPGAVLIKYAVASWILSVAACLRDVLVLFPSWMQAMLLVLFVVGAIALIVLAPTLQQSAFWQEKRWQQQSWRQQMLHELHLPRLPMPHVSIETIESFLHGLRRRRRKTTPRVVDDMTFTGHPMLLETHDALLCKEN